MRYLRRVFTIFISFDAATAARIDKLVALFDGVQQAQVDALTARLTASEANLKAAESPK